MIRYVIDPSQPLRIKQVESTPTVYLDHWALRHISTTDELCNRFAQSLLSSNGTLMLSWLNLVEFAKVTDRHQTDAAERLIEAVLPNVFFMEINPFTVIEREDRLLAGGTPIPPHADTGFLKAFAALKPSSLKPFTAHELLSTPGEADMSSLLDSLADTIAKQTAALRTEVDSDENFRSAIRRLPSGPILQQGTRYVLRELARTFFIDRSLKVSRNHAIDLLHSVVPVAYCDLVLLDKHWEEQIERMRTRFADAKLSVPVARAFSRRKNGLDRFLLALKPQ